MHLNPGDIVYGRHWQRNQLGGLFPLRTVADRFFWAPAGTTHWHFNLPDGRGMDEATLAEWSNTPRVPVARVMRHGLLTWHPAGVDYSIRWFFRPTGEFYAWYANLERSATFSQADGLTTFDTVDWDLDVWIHPDRRWEWKDEELFATRLREPDLYWVDDPDRVWRAGKEVVALAEAAAFPFNGAWCDFRPDPAWPPLPSDRPPAWNRPPAW